MRNAFGRRERLGQRGNGVKVFLTNFGYFLKNGAEFQSFEAAQFNAQQAGFEASLVDAVTGETLGWWSPITGARKV